MLAVGSTKLTDPVAPNNIFLSKWKQRPYASTKAHAQDHQRLRVFRAFTHQSDQHGQRTTAQGRRREHT